LIPFTTITRKPEPPIRRPEVARLAEQLKRQNPSWTEDQCRIQAKLIVTSKPTQS
jgi:hypothetical protein